MLTTSGFRHSRALVDCEKSIKDEKHSVCPMDERPMKYKNKQKHAANEL